MSDDVRLDLLKDAIAESDLDGQTKDALADDLRYAQEINGGRGVAGHQTAAHFRCRSRTDLQLAGVTVF
jgi:hypothetical protein